MAGIDNKKIIACREKMGLNQKEFAKKVGIKQSDLSLFENTGLSPWLYGPEMKKLEKFIKENCKEC